MASREAVTFRYLFYALFAIFQICICGLAGWTLHEVVRQGKEMARIEEHLNMQPYSDGQKSAATALLGILTANVNCLAYDTKQQQQQQTVKNKNEN